jgi:hypothetical protein
LPMHARSLCSNVQSKNRQPDHSGHNATLAYHEAGSHAPAQVAEYTQNSRV